MNAPFAVEYAKIEWLDNNVPFSTTFQDTYFSKAGGLTESQYVYIEQNDILSRCEKQNLLKVGEVGFGTGLNFLLTWRAWLEAGNSNCQLDYVAFEKNPLTAEDLARSLSSWPELGELSQQLLLQYPVMIPGHVRIPFSEGKITLTLIIGDVFETINEIGDQYDAWYLDGFAPRKNPDLWTKELCEKIYLRSQSGTTFSTFTAVGAVRRNFQELGFSVEKFSGFANKRESIKGTLIASPPPLRLLAPWKCRPATIIERNAHIFVIGGGLAGFGVAHALCRRGFQVTILEASSQGLGGASGNLAGIFAPYLARSANLTTDLYLTSFLFSLAAIKELERHSNDTILTQSGALQLLHTERLQQLAKDLPSLGFDNRLVQATTFANKPALELSLAGFISPALLCNCIEKRWENQLVIKKNTQVTSLIRQHDSWELASDDDQTFSGRYVVICSAHHSSRFPETSWVPLEPIRGELIYSAATEKSSSFKQILMGKGYVLPSINNIHVIGADYAHNNMDLSPDSAVHRKLIEQAVQIEPSLQGSEVVSSRASFRTSTHHRLPYLGSIAKYDLFQTTFTDLKKGYPHSYYRQAEYHPGLFISAGHGSRGLVSTLAAGELLGDLMTGTTPLFKESLIGECNPSSYLARSLLRG